MRSLISQLRYTVRLLLKAPGFTVTAILVLGFGIGLNTAIFSLIDGVVLKPLPYPNPERLATVYMSFQNMEYVPLDYPDYEDMKTAQHSFDSMAAYLQEWMDVAGQGEAERINGAFVSADIFKVSGRPPILGRGFTTDEDRSGGPAVVVLSEKFWRHRFNSDLNVIGRRLTVSGRTLEVIGVAPAQAFEWEPADLYLPIHLMRIADFSRRDQHEIFCLGRLKAGIDIDQARSELEVIQHNLGLRYPDINKGYQLKVTPQLDFETSPFAPILWSFGAAATCLLLIATSNVANLMTVRMLERRRMVTIRAALGAPRLALIGQQFLETATITLLGGLVGIVICYWTINVIKVICAQGEFGGLGRFQEIGIDGTAILFFFAVTVITALGCGVIPAWTASKTSLTTVLGAEGSKSATVGVQRQRLRSLLVIVQVALTCTLVVGAGLLIRSLQIVESVPLGFNPDHVLGAITFLSNDRYTDKSRVREFYDNLLERARSLPGVTAAALNDAAPFRGYKVETLQIPSNSVAGSDLICDTQTISSDYFRTLQIPILQGRAFDTGDGATEQQVVIIDEAIAHQFFRDRTPLWEQISFAGHQPSTYTIVGVVGSVRVSTPDGTQPPKFQAYFPYTQNPSRAEALLLRTIGEPRDLIPSMRKLVASIDPDTTVFEVGTLNEWIGQFLATRRIEVVIISFFSAAALLLAAVGLYGILSYVVRQRKREIGVRIALGAQAANILKLVIRQGFDIVGTGLLIGVLSALLLSRLIQSLLFGVSSDDPITLGFAITVLGLTGFFACLLPALRAMRTDPITVLRE